MWQTLISVFIIAIALLFIGKKVYRMLRRAADPEQDVSCSCGCSGCGVADCGTKKVKPSN